MVYVQCNQNNCLKNHIALKKERRGAAYSLKVQEPPPPTLLKEKAMKIHYLQVKQTIKWTTASLYGHSEGFHVPPPPLLPRPVPGKSVHAQVSLHIEELRTPDQLSYVPECSIKSKVSHYQFHKPITALQHRRNLKRGAQCELNYEPCRSTHVHLFRESYSTVSTSVRKSLESNVLTNGVPDTLNSNYKSDIHSQIDNKTF